MTLVKTKFEANKHKQNQSNRTLQHLRKLFRCEVIWVHCFHWPKTATCGKYFCACAMSEWCFVRKHERKYKKKKKKILVLGLALVLMPT